MSTMKTYKITGREAIRIAARDGVTLQKHADPIEGYRSGLSLDEAADIARHDESLLFISVIPSGWTGHAEGYQVDDYFAGTQYQGPDTDGLEPIWADAPPS